MARSARAAGGCLAAWLDVNLQASFARRHRSVSASCLEAGSNLANRTKLVQQGSTAAFKGRARPARSGSFIGRRRPLKVSAVAGGVRAGRPSHGYDYYELLGVDPAANPMQIKQAYRWLQKRCHPDVAGDQLGHDMAVLLNEAYSVLADGQLRAAYDHTRVTWIEDDSFTGQPIHSTWHGHPDEQQAVFVDETTCVGCLNCALIASETFAIETHYGRARCVRQWGNDEHTISDAIASCPVNCIHMVDRQKLPALEYIMAQLPRHGVGAEVHTAGLKRGNVDVFEATEYFLAKRERQAKRGFKGEEETPAQRAARRRAAEAIHATQTLRGMDLSWFMGAQINDQHKNRGSRYKGPEDTKTQALVWVSAKEAQAAAAASEWVKAFSPEGTAAAKAKVDYKYFGEGGLPETDDRGESDPLPYYAPDRLDEEASPATDALKALHKAAARRQGGHEQKESSRVAQQVEEEYWSAPKGKERTGSSKGNVFVYSADGEGVKRRVSFAKAHADKGPVNTSSARAANPQGVNDFQERLQKRADSSWVHSVPTLVGLFQAVRVGLTYGEAAEVTTFAGHELKAISNFMLAVNNGIVSRMLFSGVAWYTIAAAGCALFAGALAIMDESGDMQKTEGKEGAGEEAQEHQREK